MVKKYQVATFYHPRSRDKVHCYLRDYNPDWEGCVIYKIEAESGYGAKKIARKMRLNRELDRILNR